MFSASQCGFAERQRPLLLLITHKVLPVRKKQNPLPRVTHCPSLTHPQLPSAVAEAHRDFPSTNPASPPCSCPSQEVKRKGKTFFSAQDADFLRLLVSPVASCTKAFSEQSLYCSSTGMGYTQTEHGSLRPNPSVQGTWNTNAHLYHLFFTMVKY